MGKEIAKWRRQPEARPGQILDAALEVFAMKGFRNATMEEIARSAGITKGTIYLYFASKEDVFLSMLRLEFDKAITLLPRMALDPGQDLEGYTARLGKELLDMLMAPRITKVVPLVIAELNHLPSLRKFYQEEVVPKANIQLAKLLTTGMEMGFIRRMNPIIAARCLLGMYAIFVITQEVFGAKEVTPMDTAEIARTIASIYFRGVYKQEGDL